MNRRTKFPYLWIYARLSKRTRKQSYSHRTFTPFIFYHKQGKFSLPASDLLSRVERFVCNSTPSRESNETSYRIMNSMALHNWRITPTFLSLVESQEEDWKLFDEVSERKSQSHTSSTLYLISNNNIVAHKNESFGTFCWVSFLRVSIRTKTT